MQSPHCNLFPFTQQWKGRQRGEEREKVIVIRRPPFEATNAPTNDPMEEEEGDRARGLPYMRSALDGGSQTRLFMGSPISAVAWPKVNSLSFSFYPRPSSGAPVAKKKQTTKTMETSSVAMVRKSKIVVYITYGSPQCNGLLAVCVVAAGERFRKTGTHSHGSQHSNNQTCNAVDSVSQALVLDENGLLRVLLRVKISKQSTR